MQVTPQTIVADLLNEHPGTKDVFEKHGIEVDYECDAVLDFALEDCETMCHIDDLDALIADLNAYLAKE